jgi:hypothetical protein
MNMILHYLICELEYVLVYSLLAHYEPRKINKI